MKAPLYQPVGRHAPRYLGSFDSGTSYVRALSAHLRGEGYPGIGAVPDWEAPFRAVNAIPREKRATLYKWGRWAEAVPPEKLHRVHAEDISRWVVNAYPTRGYRCLFVGASNGAAVHLAAAMGAPWLPQTVLIPVRHDGRLDPDDPAQFLAWGRRPGRALLEHNPDLLLYHMLDPVQDRVMVHRMTYFRVKRLHLGDTYARFIQDRLYANAPIILLGGGKTWPSTGVEERHVFQFGAAGGATQEELFEGGTRVEEFLARYGAHRDRWDAPEPDAERPEAEWGYDDTLTDDVVRIARRRGHPVHRLVVDEPEDLSPFVADLHRWWYERLDLPTNRLLVDSFILQDPYWTLRTRSIPYWALFNSEPSRNRLATYLDNAEEYDEIHAMLFSHGTESIGIASVADWRAVAERARREGGLLGVDADAYPLDLAANVRYHQALLERLKTRDPLPPPLAFEDLQAFVKQRGERYAVRWEWDVA